MSADQAAAAGDTPADNGADQPDATWSVAELSDAITEAFSQAFPTRIWVRGEITGFHAAPSGHAYFTLIEQGASADKSTAKLPVALFAGARRSVDAALAGTGLNLEDGIEIRVAGDVAYYAQRSQAQLLMRDIDPAFTIGQLAVSRERLLQALADGGLLEKNKLRPLPPVPLRVGLVTSDGSAACADFLDELRNSGYAFEVVLCDARVQGADAPASLVAAIATLERYSAEAPRQASSAAPLDVIAMVRGGGGRTDLLAFDTEPVARAVANCSLPMVVGIGHEIDESVVDHVAHSTYKTPTACADALVEMVAAYNASLAHSAQTLSHRVAAITQTAKAAMRQHSHSVRSAVTNHLAQANIRLDGAFNQLHRNAELAVSNAESTLARTAENLNQTSARLLAAAQTDLTHYKDLIHSHDPKRILERGFSITRNADGSVVRTLPEPNDELVTTTQAGSIRSTVNDSVSN